MRKDKQRLSRKVVRNILRKQYGNKDLAAAFERYQDKNFRGINYSERG